MVRCKGLNTVRLNTVYIDYIYSIYPNGIQTPYNRIYRTTRLFCLDLPGVRKFRETSVFVTPSDSLMDFQILG